MIHNSRSHHQLPESLDQFADLCQSSNSVSKLGLKGLSLRKKSARDHFVKRVKMPFHQLPEGRFPALYFTRNGQHPVIIRERIEDDYSIRLWDGRESVCSAGRLQKTLQDEGFLMAGPSTPNATRHRFATVAKIATEIYHQRRPFSLGLGNGAVSLSILILALVGLHQSFDSAFHSANIDSIGLAILAVAVTLLASFAYLQARFFIGRYFEAVSASRKAKARTVPPIFSIQRISDVKAGRRTFEVVAAPFLLVAAVAVASYNPWAISSWATMLGCSIAGYFYLANLVDLLKDWKKAASEVHRPVEPVEDALSSARETPHLDITNAAIRTHNLFLEHPDETQAPIIDNISLQVEKGEKVGILGKTSADCAVFLSVVSGIINPDRGMVWMKGKVGGFSEKSSLIEGTLRENIMIGSDGTDKDLKKIAKLTGYCADTDWDAPISESGSELSQDDRNRLLLSRALIGAPNTLVLDSPRGVEHQEWFELIVKAYLKIHSGATLLLGAKHHRQLEMTERTIQLENGKITADHPTILLDEESYV